jgi:heme-dependent oxidative N-demethylase alpha subunit-like protein
MAASSLCVQSLRWHGRGQSVSDKARYFPVRPEPLRMQPGLSRFGSDFGNGALDAQFFPRDRDEPRYLADKAAVLASHPERFVWRDGARERTALARVADWIDAQLALERGASPVALADGFDVARRYGAFAAALAEDLVVIARGEDGAERAILVHVCFPSGWRPEAIAGQSFAQIHAPVPAFEAVSRTAPALVSAMIERGPYVRFVWGVTADARLDHHPEHGARDAWSAATATGYLRVERQVTVPFPDVSASLFLIRTYLYAFDELDAAERNTLASALAQTSPEVLAYKGLANGLAHVLALLR